MDTLLQNLKDKVGNQTSKTKKVLLGLAIGIPIVLLTVVSAILGVMLSRQKDPKSIYGETNPDGTKTPNDTQHLDDTIQDIEDTIKGKKKS